MKSSLHSLINLLPLFSITFRFQTLSSPDNKCQLRRLSHFCNCQLGDSVLPVNGLNCTALHCTALHSLTRSSCTLGAVPQRTPLATPLLLLRDFTAYVLTQSHHVRVMYRDTYCCVRELPSNGRFSASTVLALSKYATISVLSMFSHPSFRNFSEMSTTTEFFIYRLCSWFI
jgi:hypothetical protein